MLTKRELTKWELTKWEVKKVGTDQVLVSEPDHMQGSGSETNQVHFRKYDAI